MPEKLTLDAPITRSVKWVGENVQIADFEIMGFAIHREPDFDEATGARTGWKADGSRVDVTIVGAYGQVVTVPLYRGQAALDAMGQLNTANMSTKSLRQRLIEAVETYVDEAGNQPYTGTVS